MNQKRSATKPVLPEGLELDTVEPMPGRWVIASNRLAKQLEMSTHQLSRVFARHIERFGAEYAAAFPEGTKIMLLDVRPGIQAVVVCVELRGLGMVLAVVCPHEQANGERAVGALRRHLQARVERGGQ